MRRENLTDFPGWWKTGGVVASFRAERKWNAGSGGRSFRARLRNEQVRGFRPLAQRNIQFRGSDLSFPAANYHGGDTVSDQVRNRAAFAHEPIDADEQGEAFNR